MLEIFLCLTDEGVKSALGTKFYFAYGTNPGGIIMRLRIRITIH